MPPTSVIVPVHGRADLAARCLAALDQWAGDLDVVVVDDGSRDPEVDRLQQARSAAPRPLRWLRNDAPRGFSAAINRGVEAAQGDPLLLLNSDAEVRPEGRAAILEAFAADPRLGAVAARLLFPDGRPQWSGGAEPTLAWLFAQASGLGASTARLRSAPSGFAGGDVEWAPAAALAIRRTAWAVTGPFDESFAHYAQDLDYGHRLRAAGMRIAVVPRFEVVHHFGGSAGGSASAGQRLDLLWPDLVRWVAKARGARAAARARRALRLGGLVRRARLGRRAPERVQVEAALAALAQSGRSALL